MESIPHLFYPEYPEYPKASDYFPPFFALRMARIRFISL